MNSIAAAKIISESAYPVDNHLDDLDCADIYTQYQEAMKTTNGDTGPVTITARQAILLLRSEAIRSIL